MPITLDFFGKVPVPDGTCERHHNHAISLGLPKFTEVKRDGQLAIIGGGPSIVKQEEEIKAFKGDIWAVNGAWRWCEERGIDATFCSVDPHPIVKKWMGGRKAMLGTQVDPEVLEFFKGGEIVLWTGYGSSTACGLAVPAIKMGYKGITYYGCESSYTLFGTHAYQDEDREEEFIVVVNGKFFLTCPDFFTQAKELAGGIDQSEGYICERSGGLLREMVRSKGEYSVVYISPVLRKQLEWKKKVLEPAMDQAKEKPFHFVNGAFIHPDSEEAA